ncbi:MAG: YncE family protein [Nitrospirae bacterium]|nr:YncE family protein [Nitrospirota bacterium]
MISVKKDRMRPTFFLSMAFLLASWLSGSVALGGSFEIWVANQGLDKIQIIDGESLKVTAEIEADADGKPATSKPHMILFSPDYKYAYVANVGSAPKTNNILVIRASDRKIVATLPSGPVTHAVTPSPDGKRAFATSVGGDTLIEILTDASKESFAVGREIPVGDGPGNVKDRPICVFFSADSRKVYVTNGGDPAAVDPLSTGSVSIIDVESGKQLKQFSNVGQEACGLALSKDGGRIYINVGGYVNVYATIDTKTDTVIRQGNSGGYDSHGIRLSPDGKELWLANRLSNSITIVDASTDKITARITEAGDRPDLIDFSPDGSRAFLTLRGQAVTKTVHDVTGKEPGLAVIEVKDRKRTAHVALEGDPHGLAVRPK